MDTITCTTCARPAHAGYYNIRRDEQCCDPCHGPYLTPMSNQSARFAKFHGRKAKRYMRRVAA